MTAFNVVRFRVKPGREEEFLEAHRTADADFAGYRGGVIIKTGDRTYCYIGGWDRFANIVAARPQMIGMLDQVRDLLEDLGGDIGVTDPVSGETVVELPAGRGKKAGKRSQRKSAAKGQARKATARSRRTGDESAGETDEPEEET